MKKIILVLSFMFMTVSLGAIASWVYLNYEFEQKLSLASNSFVVNQGDSWIKVLNRLKEEGFIKSNSAVKYYVSLRQKAMGPLSLIPGRYEVREDYNLRTLVENILDHRIMLSKLVIPEGYNVYQIAELVEAAKLGSKEKFLKLCFDSNFIRSLGLEFKSLEGFLFPDGYKFSETDSEKIMLKQMVRRYQERYQQYIQPFEHQINLSPRQIQILASIVEKETGAPQERPLIASVFFNRLQKRMRLQSDPTTIYGLLPKYNGNLKREDLRTKTDYNTYAIPALPIGPISNPGLDALRAVVNPAESPYLFFVSRNDGTHVFTKSLGEHNEAVEKWQRSVENRAGKSWRDLEKKTN